MSVGSVSEYVQNTWFFPSDDGGMLFGGQTDARFLFGFGDSLGSPHLPEAQADVQRSLTYYLDGGVEGNFPSFSREAVTPITNPSWNVIKQDGSIRREGLFSVQRPCTKVICPSYVTKDRLVIRMLSKGELSRL